MAHSIQDVAEPWPCMVANGLLLFVHFFFLC